MPVSRSTPKGWRRGALRVALLGVALLIAPRVSAQSNSGAADLLFPIGARATGMGDAFITERSSESIWHNPAGLARLLKPEFGIDHFSTFQVEGADAISLALPAHAIG